MVSRGGRRRSLAETDRPPPVAAPSGVSAGGLWTGGSGSKSSGGGARGPLPRLSSPTNSARLSMPTHGGGASTAAATASAGTAGGSRGGVPEGGGAGEAAAAASAVSRDISSAGSGQSASLSSVIPGILQSTDLDIYGRGDDAVFGPGAAAATQYEAAAALEATRRRMSVVGAGEHVDRDGWGRGDSAIFGKGASTIAARDTAAAYRRAQRRSARRGYIVPAAVLIDGRWRRELRPGRWIGSRPASGASAVGGSVTRVGGGSVPADTSASSEAVTSLRAGVSRSSGSFVASGGTRTSLDMGGDDHFIPITAGGTFLDRTDEPRSLSRGITTSSTGSALVFPAAEEPSVGGVEEPATADLFDSDDMALLASYGRRRGEASSGGSSGPLWTAGGRRASGSTEEPSTSELLRDETGLEAAAAVAAREAAAARGEDYEGDIGGMGATGGTAGIASRTSPVVAEGSAYGVRIYLDGGADSDSDSSSGVDPPVGGAGREYSPEVEALLFGDDSENDGDVEESVQGMGDGGSRGATTTGSTLVCTTGSGSGSRRRSSTADENARDMIDNSAPDDSWPLGDGGDIYAGTTGEYDTEGSHEGLTTGEGITEEWAGDTAGVIGGGPHAGVSDVTSPSSRGGTTSETATVAAAAATAAAAAASTVSAIGSSPDDWGSEADDAPSSSARFASASTDLSVPGAGVLADGESDADALRAPEEELDVAEEQGGGWSPLGCVPSAGNDDTDDGAIDPASTSASSLGDGPVTGIWPVAGNATADALSPLQAAMGTGEGSAVPSVAAAAGTDPPTAPLAAVVPEPLLESPKRQGSAASDETTEDKSTSPHSGPSSATMPVASNVGLDTPAGGISAAIPTEQPPVASPVPVDGKAGDASAEPPLLRLAAAPATDESKATAWVTPSGSALTTTVGTATELEAESTAEANAGADVEISSGDGVDSDAASRLSSLCLADASAAMGNKATGGVTTAGSALVAVAGIATGRGAEPTVEPDAGEGSKGNIEAGAEASTEADTRTITEGDSEADAETASSDDTLAVGQAGDSPVQATKSRLAAATATVGSRDTAGMAVAGSAVAAVAGTARGWTGEPTVEADAEASSGNGAPADDVAVVSIGEGVRQPVAQPAGAHPTANPAAGPALDDSTAAPAVGGAAASFPASATATAGGIAAAPFAAPASDASKLNGPPAVTQPSSMPVAVDTAAVNEVTSGADSNSANTGNGTITPPIDVVKLVPAAAVLPANEDALAGAPSEEVATVLPVDEDVVADMPSESTDEEHGPTGEDVASDDDFTADAPSTGSWAGNTAPIGTVVPTSAVLTTGAAAALGGASTSVVAAAATAIATADPASATEPDEADEYTTAIDGWEDSLVLARGGGGSHGIRTVHFGRAPSSNATSATDDDARYYDARLELP